MTSRGGKKGWAAPARSEVERLAHRLLEVMPRVRIKLTSLMNNALSRGHLNVPQYNALSELVLHGPLTMGQLTAALSVSTAAATNLVDRLVEMKLVERRRDDSDRRVVVVKARAKGRLTVEGVRRNVAEVIIGLLERLPLESGEQFVSTYEQINELAGDLPVRRTR